MFKIVHFRANRCHVLVINQTINFVLNAKNFVVEFLSNQSTARDAFTQHARGIYTLY